MGMMFTPAMQQSTYKNQAALLLLLLLDAAPLPGAT
jgi:hypothetical protein